MALLFIFDMDGTLTPQRASNTAPFSRILLPGVRDKCMALRAAGHTLAIASNQGGARRGRTGRLTIGAVHAQMRWLCRELGIATYRFALQPARGKPAPAMLYELMAEFGASPSETTFVGDAESDQQAAQAAGVNFIWAEQFFFSGGDQ